VLDSVKDKLRPDFGKSSLFKSTDALSIWNKFAKSYKLNEQIQVDIALELASAVKWQGLYSI
jgi:hypothetical protein